MPAPKAGSSLAKLLIGIAIGAAAVAAAWAVRELLGLRRRRRARAAWEEAQAAARRDKCALQAIFPVAQHCPVLIMRLRRCCSQVVSLCNPRADGFEPSLMLRRCARPCAWHGAYAQAAKLSCASAARGNDRHGVCGPR